VLTGADLKLVTAGYSQEGEPIVSIEFSKKGSEIFRQVTSKSVGKPIAIVLDGKVISAPRVNEPIAGGQAQISGSFSNQEMRDLVIKLKAGSLPIPVEIISNKIVGASLGQDSIEASKIAFMIGFVLVCLFMIAVYRLPGLLASIALGTYLLMSLAVLKLFGATLTLPGIAGFILTMGMAVDANVIIFERIKEEMSGNVSIKKALHQGFERAFKTIIDANITTLVAAFVLFWLGTGSIKGFAITLSVGILVSMYSSIVLTKLLLLGFSPILEQHKKLFFKVKS
jgi:preprotein translocase subunit SecD